MSLAERVRAGAVPTENSIHRVIIEISNGGQCLPLKAQRHRVSPNVRPSSLRILIIGLLRSLLIIEFNLALTQTLACSDEILDTVGVFARRSFVVRVSNKPASGDKKVSLKPVVSKSYAW